MEEPGESRALFLREAGATVRPSYSPFSLANGFHTVRMRSGISTRSA